MPKTQEMPRGRCLAPVRWGILGAGGIARRFAASVAASEDGVLVAASRRTKERADVFLDQVGAAGARGYGSHDELLADSRVDAVYLALPHGMHLEWCLRALSAGKPVLCEKPLALSSEDARRITAAAREAGVPFMEAMKARFTPAAREVMREVSVGVVGRVRSVEASLCNDALQHFRDSNSSYIFDSVQGGTLLDCGIYCASWLEALLPGAIALESVDVATVPARGCDDGGATVDAYVGARLKLGGVPALLECAMDRAKPRRCEIVGERGRIVVEDLHRPQAATVLVAGEEPRRIDAPYVVDDFFGELEHFNRMVRTGTAESPVMPHGASVRCAQILDAVRAGFPRAR